MASEGGGATAMLHATSSRQPQPSSAADPRQPTTLDDARREAGCSSTSSEEGAAVVASSGYQDSERFCTWRKHTKHLYQQLMHVDLVWESAVAQFMPYSTQKDHLTTHNILTATRTGGQEQCFLQLISATMPSGQPYVEGDEPAPFCEATGEVGGFGMAPHSCGIKMERRMCHNGDVLAARYMWANPLVLASTSSDSHVYVFDWSRVSLNKYPNDPPRPRAPLPPNEVSSEATEEERVQYQKRMRALNAAITEQDRWDRRRGEGQHLLSLTGANGPADNLDWSTQMEGRLASGSTGRVCVWEVGHTTREADRLVRPLCTHDLEDDEARATSLAFSWQMPHVYLCSTTSGSVFFNDCRAAESTEIFSHSSAATSLAISPLDGNSILTGLEDGTVCHFDLRKSSAPVEVEVLHAGEVTTLRWCPHTPHLFLSAGADGDVVVYNHTRRATLFRHTGHCDGVMDANWNWHEGSAGQIVSTDVNAMMLWRPRDRFLFG